jgi:hypothetical protein
MPIGSQNVTNLTPDIPSGECDVSVALSDSMQREFQNVRASILQYVASRS